MISQQRNYLNWLIEIISDKEHTNYYDLLEYLMSIDFRWSVPMDENRAEDGVHLRLVYEDVCLEALDNDDIHAPCTVLEMMVALSVRGAEDILWDGDFNWAPVIFWSMITNLGLEDYKDGLIDAQSFPELERKINDFLDRNYDKNGGGGLFLYVPNFVPNPQKWKKIEIWYQMAYWINDNFL